MVVAVVRTSFVCFAIQRLDDGGHAEGEFKLLKEAFPRRQVDHIIHGASGKRVNALLRAEPAVFRFFALEIFLARPLILVQRFFYRTLVLMPC